MKKEWLLVSISVIGITLLFFYPIFNGRIPFPGDLLVAEYPPYNSYSFLGYAPGAYPHKAQNFDVLRLLYPAKEFAIDMLKNGQLPLWNPYNFSGNPHLASLQSGIFYPLNIVFFLFSFIPAWSLFIILQPILASIFTYLFLRELKIGRPASFFGGIVFAFSSYMIVWMQYGNVGHSIIWMPFVLLLLTKNLKSPSIIKSILTILFLSFSIFAGYIQTTFYVFLFAFCFSFFQIFVYQRNVLFQRILLLFFLFATPLLLSAIQLLPTIELLQYSARIPYSKEALLNLLIPQFHLAILFAPDFFGNPATRTYFLPGTYIERVISIGVIPLFFAITTIFRKKDSLSWFFIASCLAILLLTFDSFVSRTFYKLLIPYLSTTVPTRIMFIFCFSASMLSAMGLDTFLKNKNTMVIRKPLFLIGGIYILLWISTLFIPTQDITVTRKNLILPSGLFMMLGTLIFFSRKRELVKKHMVILLFGLTVFDLFYFFHKITPFSPKESVYPKTEVLSTLKKLQGIDRSWGFGGNSYLETNIHTHERIFSPDGYDALHLRRYGEFLSTSATGKLADPPPRSEAVITHEYGLNFLRVNEHRQRILDLLGVKYILYSPALTDDNIVGDYQNFPSEIYTMLWNKAAVDKKGGWQLYENRRALPRAFLASGYQVERNKKKVMQTILGKDFDPAQEILLEESLPGNFDLTKDENSVVSFTSYSPNKITLKSKSSGNTLLFLSDAYFPGWSVKIDGKDGKIYRANYAFRAVPLQKGTHDIVFLYYPQSFDRGFKISMWSLAGIGSLVFISLVKKRYA